MCLDDCSNIFLVEYSLLKFKHTTTSRSPFKDMCSTFDYFNKQLNNSLVLSVVIYIAFTIEQLLSVEDFKSLSR